MKMSKTTFINAILIDPKSNTLTNGSLTIEDGFIDKINGPSKGNIIDCKNKYLAPGVIDLGVHICEPGERHKESFKSASMAAASGGVTSIVTFPNTIPVIDNPELLEFFMKRARESSKVRIFPTAAITKKVEGKEISELSFLQDAGAIAFTNGLKTIKDPKILLRALNYASSLQSLFIGHCEDYYLSNKVSATSSLFSTKMGLSSAPRETELMGLERDTLLSDLAKVNYHAAQITTKKSFLKIKELKSKKNNISAGISIHHLLFDESYIENYRTFFKLSPPLRSISDKEFILKNIKDDTIDTISSFHLPQDEESKRLPYEKAAFGAIGLQTLLPACLKLVHDKILDLPTLFKKISLNPAKLLNLKSGILKEDYPADLILFDPDKPFTVDRFKLLSKAKNTPFDGYKLYGEVLKTFVKGNEIYKSRNTIDT